MYRNKSLAAKLTAVAVAAAFALPASAAIYNDAQAETIESLQNRLLDLKDAMNNVQAQADAEKRDLTADERTEFEGIVARIEETFADIERRKKQDEINARLAAPQQRQTEPNGLQPGEQQGQQQGNQHETRAQAAARGARASVPAQPRNTDTGKWGFRSQAEFYNAVMRASRQGGSVDPRLIANAPTTYGQEGVGADGGFAVPPDFRQNIITKVMGEESLLSRTDQMTTSSNAITIPADQTTPWQATGGIQAYWESEAGQKTQSKPQLSGLTVKANKIIALVPLTDELLEDAPAMASYVNRKAPEKIDFKVNDAIINGSGVGMPLGILSSAGTIEVAAESGQTAATVRFENIVNMWSRLAASAKRRAVWLANDDIEAQLMQMKFPGSDTAIPVYLPPGGLSVSPYGTLLGRPVLTSEAMPALGDSGDLILADMTQYLSVVKAGGIRQDVSIHVFFDYDVTAFRFVLRVGGQPYWNTAIARLNSQPSKGFFVKLGARD